MIKAVFSASLLQSLCHVIFRNHNNMMINYQCWKQLNISLETVILLRFFFFKCIHLFKIEIKSFNLEIISLGSVINFYFERY